MNAPQYKQICEAILIEEKRYNAERNILPSENAVVDRLLARSIELTEVYRELHDKLNAHPQALRTFLRLLLSAAAFWNPEKMSEARGARDELVKVNQRIAAKAAELAGLLQQRNNLHNTSGFRSGTHYHVCDVIEAAAKANYRFRSYVQEPLERLRGEFDLKYWPSLSDFLHALASDAQNADAEATDPLTAAGTEASRPSRTDFIKALFVAIEDDSSGTFGFLPMGLKVSDNSVASLTNCALGLDVEDIVDGQYIKRFRQRQRDGASLRQRDGLFDDAA